MPPYLVIGTELLLFQSGIPFWPLSFSLSGSMVTAASKYVKEGGQEVGRESTWGWRQRGGGRWGKRWQDLRWNISMGSWRESLPTPTLPHLNLLLRSLIFLPVPPSPSHPFRSPQDLKSQILQVRPLCPLPQLLPKLQRWTFQPTCNPWGFKWGVPSACTSARLRVAKRAHQPHGPPLVPT